ncbi:hypothetical protein QQG55_39025 [Brugia pahangi]|uniref:Ovule protein n=1 Tax=Brugia pahangi TaxID=6280 RepID=A0A0N4T1J1_BRUPA|nr:unnamed protein product [Brugia pahangi]
MEFEKTQYHGPLIVPSQRLSCGFHSHLVQQSWWVNFLLLVHHITCNTHQSPKHWRFPYHMNFSILMCIIKGWEEKFIVEIYKKDILNTRLQLISSRFAKNFKNANVKERKYSTLIPKQRRQKGWKRCQSRREKTIPPPPIFSLNSETPLSCKSSSLVLSTSSQADTHQK